MDNDDLFAGTKCKWIEGSGPYADIVITSRVRLARNLEAFPFPQALTEVQQKEVVRAIAQTLDSSAVKNKFGKFRLIVLNELTAIERQILVEKHLISPEHAELKGYRAVALDKEEMISLMINEEDHLRIQVLLPALQIHESWRKANEIDDLLEKNLNFCFSETKGYLTSCPTNVGTGLRASVMLHLPGLVITKQANRILSALSQVGLTVRGLYGEGTEAAGNMFQISNQITLGRTEEEILQNLSSVIKQIVDQERSARELLLKEARSKLEDRVYRAFGALAHARIISSQEAISLLSEVRLGIDLKIIKNIDARILNELLVTIQPAYMQKLEGRKMSPSDRDKKRASIIREKLNVKFL